MEELNKKVMGQKNQQKEMDNTGINEDQELNNPQSSKELLINVPSFLKAVNQNHLLLLRDYKMYCPAIGNGACGTNCASVHMMEDNNRDAMINMKSKVNHHIADNYENVFKTTIGLPYSETVFGQDDMEICKGRVQKKKSTFCG